MRLRTSRLCFILGLSAILVLPCLWQSRVQGGDLLSHTYNAWLAEEIKGGNLEGLTTEPMRTNVLFDTGLSFLIKTVGYGLAERIAAAAAVLIFAWGWLLLMRAASGVFPWHLLPLVAIFSYGYVFHAGFFNFYLSLGLSLWALSLLWKARRSNFLMALPILALSFVAHPLPFIWALGAVGYSRLAGALPPQRQLTLLAAGVAAVALFGAALGQVLPSQWVPRQVGGVTGADQAWVYGRKYAFIAAGLVLLIASLALRKRRRSGSLMEFADLPFQIYLLTACAVAFVPTIVFLPGYNQALVYIAERMSLPAIVMLLCSLSGARPGKMEKAAAVVLAAVFFTFLYRDTKTLNAVESRIQSALGAAPARSRIVSTLCETESRFDPLLHLLDRACVGKCYSYANYEPATGQFRVRAQGKNDVVLERMESIWAVQRGEYVVREADLPLYRIFFCERDSLEICLEPAAAGERLELTCNSVLPPL